MNNEIEAKFLDIDKNTLRIKLNEIDATLIKPEFLMKRTIFYTGKNSFLRVRDEGDQIVITYKKVHDDNSILGTKEINIFVSDYDDAVLLLKESGLKIKARQETKRELWKLDNVEICIDTWPWLPTFVEIEGASELEVWKTAKLLGFKESDAKFGSVDSTYQLYYGISTDTVNLDCPEISFEIDPPKWVKKKLPKIY